MMALPGENMNAVPMQNIGLRNSIRMRIYAILQRKATTASGSAEQREQKIIKMTNLIDEQLWSWTKSSEIAYANLSDLEARVDYMLNLLRRRMQRQQQHRHACPPTTSVAMLNVSSSSHPLHTTTNNNNFAGVNNIDFTKGGFPVTCGNSNVLGFYRTKPLYSDGATYQMVDVSRPQLTSSGVSSTGFGVSRDAVPLTTTSQPSFSMAYGSNNLHGGSMAVSQDHMLPTFTNNQPYLQQTSYPLHHFAQASQQFIDYEARDIMHQQVQQSRELYPGQLQSQEHLTYQDAYRTQLPTGLPRHVNHGPSLDRYNEALQQHAMNGFKPSTSTLQYQHNAVNATHLTPSPSLPPPHPKPSAATVLVQSQPTQISENNNEERELLGAIVSQTTPKQPESLHPCSSSAREPRELNGDNSCKQTCTQPEAIHSSSPASAPPVAEKQDVSVINLCQPTHVEPEPFHCPSSETATLTVSPRSTLERKRLLDGTIKQVNGDRSDNDFLNQTRWLLLVKHAGNCRATGDTCLSKFCLLVKKLLEHMKRCKVPDCTQVPYCGQTRKLVRHYEECRNKSCPVCVPVNDFIKANGNKRGARPRESTEPVVQAYNNKRVTAEPISIVNDDLQPSAKRLKIEKPSQVESMSVSASGDVSSAPKKERCVVQANNNKKGARPRESPETVVQAYNNERGTEAISDNIKKNRNKRGARPPRESLEPVVQAHNKKRGTAEAGDDMQPSAKRLKIVKRSQKESMLVSACGDVPSAPKRERYGLQNDGCQSFKVDVIPVDIDRSDVLKIPVTLEVEKHVGAMDDDKTKPMNEMGASKEQNVKQSVDASKIEICSLVELFTPEQVKEHIRGLRQWVGQSKTKADKNKAMGGSTSADACQLCAVEGLVFEPLPIYCSPCGLRIMRNAVYYTVAAGEPWHYVCKTCFTDARENPVSIDGASIPKAKLEKKKNDEQIIEAWVQCDKCQGWQHQVCALFNRRRNHGDATKYTCPWCYIQEVEQGERRPLPQSAIPGAKSLPETTLSNHIEQRLLEKLHKERQERARLEGKSYEEVPGAESLTVRVVASVDKVLQVKENFLQLFQGENYPSEYPYKSKVILLFQEIEGVEVCLFGMFVQEYGTESGPANQRRVHLSYLDSVKYFRPEVRAVSGEALRTFVYQEILIGYLDYCKKRGFTSCYIWACPPLKGEDYILNGHPEIQKTPKTDKLREWYLAMVKKASKEDVVVECTNLYDQYFVQSGECRTKVTAARLPYFDGDYWPGTAEDILQQMRQQGDGINKLNRKGYTKKVISKRALRAVDQLDLPVNTSKDRLLLQKLGGIICPLKEDFIMVHLQHCCKHCCTLMVSGNRWVCSHCKNFQICDKCYEVEQNRTEKERHPINQKKKHTLVPVAIKDVPIEIEDKDDNIQSEFFDNRQAFLSLCQGNNYQYDTLRRAKHSSMMILYHLHNPSVPAFPTACTICQQEIENAHGWHCQVCTAYDVCNACHPKASIDHPHKLISRSSAAKASAQDNRQANQIQSDQMIEKLVHASGCRHEDCEYQQCRLMKTLLRHLFNCKTAHGDCPKCKQFWILIRIHARSCRDSKCIVPKCREFKESTSRGQHQSEKRRRAVVTEIMRKRAKEASQTN